MKLVFSSFQATQHGILRVHAVNAMSRKYRFLAQCLRYTREAVALYRPSSPIIVPFAYVTSMLSTLVVYILALPYRNRQFSTSEFEGHYSKFQLQKTFTSNL